jgi:hypothetical protein
MKSHLSPRLIRASIHGAGCVAAPGTITSDTLVAAVRQGSRGTKWFCEVRLLGRNNQVTAFREIAKLRCQLEVRKRDNAS